ncbi:hypothetical protein AYO49_05920 [Verrucomicrobiaceae bacterium SCGC AG-212-N21]|nr:hypothetical protein AYO49_05920 [Verrucomicrobiaceae bacterium SCGC AG-212-N21]
MTAVSTSERSERSTRRIERVRHRLAKHVSQLAAHRRWNAPNAPYWHEREAELLRQVALAQIELRHLETNRRRRPDNPSET